MGKAKFYETDEFKTIQEEWYSKLEQSPVVTKTKKMVNGTVRYEREVNHFIDIENGEDRVNIEPQVFTETKVKYDGGTDYRNFCEGLILEFKFLTAIDKLMFEKHAEGMSVRQIESWIELQGKYGSYSYPTIFRMINRIKAEYLDQIGLTQDDFECMKKRVR